LAHLLCPAIAKSEHQAKHRQKKKGGKALGNYVVNDIPKDIS